MNLKNIRFLWLLVTLLTILALVSAGCGSAAPEPASPEEPTEQEAADTAASEEEALAEEEAMEELPYGLQAGKPYEGTTIRLLLNNAAKNTALSEHAAEFTEMTGIEVEFDMVPFGSLLEKITSEGVAGTGTYDIVTFLDSWGPAIQQYLVPLDDNLQAANIDMNRYPPAYQEGVTYEGQVYGLPWRGHPQLLFYRQDVMDELGLETPTTWAEYEEVVQAITENTDLYGAGMYYGVNAGQNLFIWINFLWSNGGDLFDEEWRPTFNSPEGIEATERYVSLLRELQAAPPGSVTYNEYEGAQSVAQAEAATIVTWWWQITNLTNPENAQPEVAENINFTSVPEWEGKGGATYAISMPLSLSKDSQNPEAAWEFLKWASNPDLEKAIVTNKENPDTTTNVAVQVSNLEDTEVNEAWNNMHQFAAESLAVSRIMPQLAEWPEISNVLEVAINDIATGKPTQETLDQAATEIEQIMERAGYY